MILILWYLILKIGGLTQKYYLSEVVLRDAGVKPRKTLQHGNLSPSSNTLSMLQIITNEQRKKLIVKVISIYHYPDCLGNFLV